MALNKVIYVDGETVITAENLNEIQDAIIALEESPVQGLTEDLKQAMLQIARKVAYIDDQGQTYYDDLYDALYPPKTVVLITAVFEQGSTVIYDDTALDDLKQYLTVTAKYDDNTTAILPDDAYALSGTLESGTSTVTVAYNGLTTTFTVNVTARPTLSSISAEYTQSGTVYDTDTLDSLKTDLVVTAHYSDSSTQTVPAADYTLSGTLTTGTSTITVSYGGKTATFNVTVTKYWDFEWDYTMGSPENNGFTVTVATSGGSAVMTDDYFAMTSGTSSGTFVVKTPDFTSADGIIEAEILFPSIPPANSDGFSFTGPKWRYVCNGGKFYLLQTDYELLVYNNVLANTWYKLRTEYTASGGCKFYINDELINDYSSPLNSTFTRFIINSAKNAGTVYIRAMRARSL